MEGNTQKPNGIFEIWNKFQVLKPRNIRDEVAREFGIVKKNSRQRYRARRKEEFLRKKRGKHDCFMLEGNTHTVIHRDVRVKSEFGDGDFIVIPRPGQEK